MDYQLQIDGMGLVEVTYGDTVAVEGLVGIWVIVELAFYGTDSRPYAAGVPLAQWVSNLGEVGGPPASRPHREDFELKRIETIEKVDWPF